MEDIENIPYTCPYIDDAIGIVESYMDNKNAVIDTKQLLEEVRGFNHRLREYGYAAKDLLDESRDAIEDLEEEVRLVKNNLEDAEYEINQLRREIEALEGAYQC